jgi:hypothetical protein
MMSKNGTRNLNSPSNTIIQVNQGGKQKLQLIQVK